MAWSGQLGTNSLEEARRLSVNGQEPIASAPGWWIPGGYERVGGQLVRPQSAGPLPGASPDFVYEPWQRAAENAARLENAAAASAAAASAPPAGGGFRMEGFDAAKLGNLEHDTPKYQIARVLQRFDPRYGITDEVLAALNQLGIGTFVRTSGDKVRMLNADPRFQGVTDLDLVRGLHGPGGGQAWQYLPPSQAGGGAAAAPSVGLSAPPVPSNTSSYISDPAPTGTPTEATLPAIDRAVLTSQMRDGSERTTSGDPALSSNTTTFPTDYTSPANAPRVQAALADLQTPPTSIAELNRRALTSQMNGDR